MIRLVESRSDLSLPCQSVIQLPRRLLFIDVARSLAIVLALLAHAMSAYQGYALFGPTTKLWTKMLTRTATPMFVFMFGMMLELVYLRRWQTRGRKPTSGRLWTRSWECYAGYLVTVLAGFLAGNRGLLSTIKASVFLATPSFGFTLRFYFFALLLAIPLLAARVRLGRPFLVAVLGLIWATYPLVARAQVAAADTLPVPFGMLLGSVTRPVGPSVLQGFTFVVAGMLCASALTGWRTRGLEPFRREIVYMLMIALIPLGFIWWQSSLPHMLESFTGIMWRRENNIGYYCIGLINTGLMLTVLSWLFPADRESPGHARFSLAFGRSSLMAFTSGNVLLILTRDWLTPSSVWSLMAILLLFLAAVWGIVVLTDWLWTRRPIRLEG